MHNAKKNICLNEVRGFEKCSTFVHFLIIICCSKQVGPLSTEFQTLWPRDFLFIKNNYLFTKQSEGNLFLLFTNFISAPHFTFLVVISKYELCYLCTNEEKYVINFLSFNRRDKGLYMMNKRN